MPRWIPKVGQGMNVMLPGELIRATCTEVVGPNIILAHLNLAVPVSKTHTYAHGQVVPVRRKEDDFGQEVWTAISDAEMRVAHEEDQRLEAEIKKRDEERQAASVAAQPRQHAFQVNGPDGG